MGLQARQAGGPPPSGVPSAAAAMVNNPLDAVGGGLGWGDETAGDASEWTITVTPRGYSPAAAGNAATSQAAAGPELRSRVGTGAVLGKPQSPRTAGPVGGAVRGSSARPWPPPPATPAPPPPQFKLPAAAAIAAAAAGKGGGDGGTGAGPHPAKMLRK